MDIRQKIDELRKLKGWSRSKLAKEAGLSETTVYNWYNENDFTPSRKAIEYVCAALEVPVAEIYSDVDIDKLSPQQIRLLELFNKVPDARKEAVIDIMSIQSKLQ